ncbi:zinc finger protein 62-like [Aedes aegypti]|uniref:Uncharacterized protein n=1 Tax=Aedes aegypti TaxID=7159 RepID=A0A6I8U5E8_AEDAE|nr:zinc finger protein 62-like [Aedes aegypti]XP_021703458.1 zinc finger protein 62-like [Aedes aegypti]
MPTQPQSIKKESINLDVHGCRLCLSEESLDHVFKEDHLREWIMDLLSIQISNDDRMSQVICAICRIRLSEFHQFRVRCQEVQEVLKAMIKDKPVTVEGEKNAHVKPEPSVSFVSLIEREQKSGLISSIESVDSDNRNSETEEDPLGFESFAKLDEPSHTSLQDEEMEVDPIGAEDSIDVEEAKVETWLDDDSELSNEHTEEYGVHTQKSKQVSDPEKDDTGTINKVKEIPPSRGIAHHSKDVDQSTDFKCLICEMEFSKREEQMKHFRTKLHLNNMKQKRRSDDGPKSSDKNDADDEGYVCLICKRSFRRKCQLENHMPVHEEKEDDQRSYNSEEVESSLSDSSAGFSDSDQEDDSEQEYHCDQCDNVFSERSKLISHTRRYHKTKRHNESSVDTNKADGSKPKKTDSQPSLAVTDRSTNGEENVDENQQLECDVCHKTYLTRKVLLRHKRLVHGPKKHQCKMCNVQYTTRAQMRQHLYTKKHLNNLKEKRAHENVSPKNGTVESNETDSSQQKNKVGSSQTDNTSAETNAQRKDDSSLMKDDINFDVYKSRRLHRGSSVEQGKCDVCHKVFPTKYSLSNHKKYHQPKKFVCNICQKPCHNAAVLKRHIVTHEPIAQRQQANPPIDPDSIPRPYKCDICKTAYKTNSTLWQHNKQKHGPKIHECDMCGIKFGTSDMLKRHVRRHIARGHTKEDFLSLKKLMRSQHTSTNQNEGDEKSDEEVSEDENAYNHRSSDYVQKSSKASSELPFQCDVCHESFPTRVLLYRHKRNLHKLKRFKCSVCDKHFAYRKQRRMHMRVHDSGSKSSNDFECVECHKIYASWKSLFAHISNGHIKRKKLSEERTIACPKCDKMFQTVYQRDLHMRTVHLPEKHRCTVCDKLFTVRVQLWQHMKTQHGGSSSSNSESDDSEGSLELSVQKYINKDKPDSEICQAASRKQPRRNAKQKSV